MATLSFDCVGVRAEEYAAAPTLTFALRISETTGARIHAVALRCQIRIEPARRRYSASEAARLADLFGDVSRWADTVKPLQFTNVTAMVPAFTGAVDVDLPVVCTFDLEVAAARYFYALATDEAPLLFLFSGTIFVKDAGGIQVEPVPWSAECSFRLPVDVWREMVDRYFPGAGWIRLDRDTIDALARYKSAQALPTWDATVLSLLGGDP
jgi:hypothetical protein